jgi:hypothetical protein
MFHLRIHFDLREQALTYVAVSQLLDQRDSALLQRL